MCVYTMPASSTPHPRLVGRGACSPRAMASALCRPQPAERCAMAPLRVRCALARRRSSKCTVAARRSPAPTSSPCSRMPEARMDHVHGPQSQRERAGRVFRVCYLLFVFATYGFRQLPDALTAPPLDAGLTLSSPGSQKHALSKRFRAVRRRRTMRVYLTPLPAPGSDALRSPRLRRSPHHS